MKNKQVILTIIAIVIVSILLIVIKYKNNEKNQNYNETELKFTNTENGIEIRDATTNTLIKNIYDDSLIKLYQDNPDYDPNYEQNENVINY